MNPDENPGGGRPGPPAGGTGLWGPVRRPGTGGGAVPAPPPPTVPAPVPAPVAAPPPAPVPHEIPASPATTPPHPLVPPPRSAPHGGPPPRPPAPPPPPAPAPSRRALPLVVAAVVAALVVATVTVMLASRPSDTDVTAAPAAPAVTDAAPAPSTPTATDPATATRPPLTSPSGTVSLADAAAAQPAAPTVLALLERHFTAINEHDYTSWADTVVPRRARDQPRDQWIDDYRTTRDSDVEVTAIEQTAPDSATVALTFVSEQDVADAPADLRAERICWQSRWPVVDLSSGGRLDRPAAGTTTKNPC